MRFLIVMLLSIMLFGCGTPRYLQGVCTLNDSVLGYC